MSDLWPAIELASCLIIKQPSSHPAIQLASNRASGGHSSLPFEKSLSSGKNSKLVPDERDLSPCRQGLPAFICLCVCPSRSDNGYNRSPAVHQRNVRTNRKNVRTWKDDQRSESNRWPAGHVYVRTQRDVRTDLVNKPVSKPASERSSERPMASHRAS